MNTQICFQIISLMKYFFRGGGKKSTADYKCSLYSNNGFTFLHTKCVSKSLTQ